jgi:hypothetical protein
MAKSMKRAKTPTRAKGKKAQLKAKRSGGDRVTPNKQIGTGSKIEKVIQLLSRASGASIVELTAATNWLPHTTRAALTGLRKRGFTVETERSKHGPTNYRLLSLKPEGKRGSLAVDAGA